MKVFRKIIKITASQSPNVRLALAQIAAGKPVTNEILVPGVITWEQYQQRRATWDKIRQTIGLDAEFYEGREVLLYPPHWLNESHLAYERIRKERRVAEAGGMDPGEGEANTSWTVVDKLGIIEQKSKKTPDTSVIVGETIEFLQRYRIPCDRFCIDRGGGGKQIADLLRSKGYPVRTIAFGESLTLPPKHGSYQVNAKKENIEERYTYINRRAQMFGELRNLLDPKMNEQVFAIPNEYHELRKQMAIIPFNYDGEGRMIIPPKNRKPGQKESAVKTLVELIGHSPDELDSLVLAVHGLLHEDPRPKAGPIWSTIGKV